MRLVFLKEYFSAFSFVVNTGNIETIFYHFQKKTELPEKTERRCCFAEDVRNTDLLGNFISEISHSMPKLKSYGMLLLF